MIDLIENIPPAITPPALAGGRTSPSKSRACGAKSARLRDESDSLVRQVLQSFEELSLLRSMAQALELRESAEDAVHLAEHALPHLREAIDAESILLATSLDDSSAAPEHAKTTFRWYGRPLLTDDQCRDFIVRECVHAAEGPVVRNPIAVWSGPIPFPGFLSHVLVEIRSQGRLCGWLAACNRVSDGSRPSASSKGGFSSAEAILLSTAASMLAAHFHNSDLLRQKDRLFTDMVRALANAIDARDPYTCGHSERVGLYASRLGREIGFRPSHCERLHLSGLLHDTGKISVPDAVLGKRGRLDAEEYVKIQAHPEAGWAILHELAALRHILPGVLHHHERYDGQGYPDGLAGEDIPLDARILAICDTYDAMTSSRPYRDGMPQERAESLLRNGAGTQWDPQLVEAFLSVMPEIIALRQNHQPRTHGQRVRSL